MNQSEFHRQPDTLAAPSAHPLAQPSSALSEALSGALPAGASEPARSPAIPRSPGFDETVKLAREGYGFLSQRFRSMNSQIFRTRLMLRDVICLTGPDAARLIYDDDRLTRVGAMPQMVLRLIAGKGSVQQLDGPVHRHRKAMFVRMLVEDRTGIDRLVAIFRRNFIERVPDWIRWGAVPLGAELDLILIRTALAWTHAPIDADEIDRDDVLLAELAEQAGHFGPRRLPLPRRSSALERRLKTAFRQIRRGRQAPLPGTPMAMIAGYLDPQGRPLSPAVAAGELINLLGPIASLGRYILFAAVELERHGEWREILRVPDDRLLTDFAEEVRRCVPFYPFVGAVARTSFDWNGYQIRRGQWLLFDLYGTCHDEAAFHNAGEFRPLRELRHGPDDYSFVAQGAGSVKDGHRCPGEEATLSIIKEGVRLLTTAIDYDMPTEQDVSVSLSDMPCRPKDGVVISGVRWQEMAAG
ncbi:cytochrome P450 [Rhizobium sp. 18065]|uniref:cytochrome P450 n=1 Tax=Rhizobium sp. 18065 TaxID=2681411 RepID=UPI001356AE08|nr:cytochrome P450 [Rhizobium sp. 18065]